MTKLDLINRVIFNSNNHRQFYQDYLIETIYFDDLYEIKDFLNDNFDDYILDFIKDNICGSKYDYQKFNNISSDDLDLDIMTYICDQFKIALNSKSADLKKLIKIFNDLNELAIETCHIAIPLDHKNSDYYNIQMTNMNIKDDLKKEFLNWIKYQR